ncbi:FAD-dependent monooxygenase [Saccharopolyspora sp. TS4A08]|uniref:FAD-dependent monooxygenase n=1 Tax=Saccharopolyspora ipomoeae TaxID=3042027 RepID=A0ABT6PKR0_9PSEU|nr:FAD-dependent monooxygenase [Saccharopolyspora sp. TS4A08]MDI2028253.1 FAD-dependent monooxygenase [Saccharopolyspora sp. TS4A08]
MSVRRVLVVGGGIGGLSATLALRQAGVEVDLVEKDAEWSVHGVGIIQPGNALRALDRLGVAEECVAQGHPMVGMRSWTADGETLLRADEFPPAGEGLPPNNGITRRRPHDILVAAARKSGARIRTGVTTSAVEPGTGDVAAAHAVTTAAMAPL